MITWKQLIKLTETDWRDLVRFLNFYGYYDNGPTPLAFKSKLCKYNKGRLEWSLYVYHSIFNKHKEDWNQILEDERNFSNYVRDHY